MLIPCKILRIMIIIHNVKLNCMHSKYDSFGKKVITWMNEWSVFVWDSRMKGWKHYIFEVLEPFFYLS